MFLCSASIQLTDHFSHWPLPTCPCDLVNIDFLSAIKGKHPTTQGGVTKHVSHLYIASRLGSATSQKSAMRDDLLGAKGLAATLIFPIIAVSPQFPSFSSYIYIYCNLASGNPSTFHIKILTKHIYTRRLSRSWSLQLSWQQSVKHAPTGTQLSLRSSSFCGLRRGFHWLC